MNNYLNRIGLFCSQILFSLITPILLMPGVGQLKVTRSIVAFCFGRSYGNRYQHIIDSFQGLYGTPMDKGLKKVKEILDDKVSIVLDCGTGTGFVSKQAAK